MSLPRLQPHLPRAAPRLPLPHRALRSRAVPGPGVSAAEAWHPGRGETLVAGKLGVGRLEPWNDLWNISLLNPFFKVFFGGENRLAFTLPHFLFRFVIFNFVFLFSL